MATTLESTILLKLPQLLSSRGETESYLNEFNNKGIRTMIDEKKGPYVGRRDFIKTTAMAVVGSTIAGTSIYAKETGILPKPQYGGGYGRKNNKLLCLSEFPQEHLEMINSIKSNYDIDLQVHLIDVNYRNPWNLVESIRGEGANILFICLGRRLIFNYGMLSRYMGSLGIPILVYSPNQDLIMIDANFVAELSVQGAHVKLAVSEMEVIEILTEVASPRYIPSSWEKEAIETLEGTPSPGFILGKKALIYSGPFDSISVPSHNLTEEYVYDHTGVEIGFRPMDELVTLLEDIDESSAMEEMERWKDEAVGVDEVPPNVLLDQCRLHDYHGFGTGLVPKVEFPIGNDVTMGS